MAELAYINDDNIVVNVIVADPDFDPAGIPIPEGLIVGRGTRYDPVTGTFPDAEPAVTPVEYRPLNKLETMTLFRMVTGMDDAGELAMRKDPALELHWMKWETDVPNHIFREHPVVEQFLNALEGLGYINAAQRQAMLDNWPTV